MVNIFNEYMTGYALLPLDKRQILTILAAMLEVVENSIKKLDSLDLFLVDDRTIADLNSRYLSCAGPTNIISFPEEERGVMVLSLDTYARECFLYGQNRTEHLVRLLAHACGHLAGLDHGEAMDSLCAACMERAFTELEKGLDYDGCHKN